MDRAIIEWDPDVVPFDQITKSRHSLLRRNGYYAILAAQLDEDADVWHSLELLYIGASFDERIGREVQRERPAYQRVQNRMRDRSEKQLVVMMGEQTGATLKRVTRGFTDDVLECLVVRHRPECNERRTQPYDGRKISVINRGDFVPLKPKCLLRPQAV